jgi:hypothetical protein
MPIIAAASTQWIDLHALWKICVVGLLAGAGLPAIFAIGLKALSLGPANAPATVSGGQTGSDGGGQKMIGGNPLGLAAGALCFAIVLAGIAYGIYFVVEGS